MIFTRLNIYYVTPNFEWYELLEKLRFTGDIPREDLEVFLTAKYGKTDCFVSGNRELREHPNFANRPKMRIMEKYILRARVMTPSERLELEACLKRASDILYNNSDSDKLETFEGIEQTVREQVLEYVSPEIALFLSKRKQEQNKGKSEP